MRNAIRHTPGMWSALDNGDIVYSKKQVRAECRATRHETTHVSARRKRCAPCPLTWNGLGSKSETKRREMGRAERERYKYPAFIKCPWLVPLLSSRKATARRSGWFLKQPVLGVRVGDPAGAGWSRGCRNGRPSVSLFPGQARLSCPGSSADTLSRRS